MDTRELYNVNGALWRETRFPATFGSSRGGPVVVVNVYSLISPCRAYTTAVGLRGEW